MINSRDINELHSTLQRGANELIKRIKEYGYPMGISSTYRDNESQNDLYAQGRTKPGTIVTNAKGGESIHNYRLAFDIFKNIKGQEFSDITFFNTAGKIWTEMGGEWGGSWASFPDKPHMQFTGGLLLKDLQAGKKMPDTIKMKWELETKEEKKGDDEEMVYKTINDVPEWGKNTINKIIARGGIQGDGNGNINITEGMTRIFVALDRLGKLD